MDHAEDGVTPLNEVFCSLGPLIQKPRPSENSKWIDFTGICRYGDLIRVIE